MAYILIVDDDPAIRLLLENLLGGAGYRTKAVTGGQEALDFITGAAPDVIVLDLMMPEMDGWQVLKELMSRERTRRIPVIIYSAVPDPEISQLAFERGAKDFWLKGKINFPEMVNRLQTILHPSNDSNAATGGGDLGNR